MKKCPFCAEEIKKEAKKCKHCGEFLEDDKLGKKEIKTESKKEEYEYKTMKIYSGLDLYLKYLPYFGWKITGNQKINYSSSSTGKSSGNQGFFNKGSFSGTVKSNTTHYYYNELSLERNKNEVPKELLEEESNFFDFIYKVLIDTNYGYIKITFIVMIILLIIVLFENPEGPEGLYFGWVIIALTGLYIGESKNNKIRKWKKNEKPKIVKYFGEIFEKYGYEI